MHVRTLRFPSRGLYAITDGPRADLLLVVEAVLRNGAAILQYRDKTLDGQRRLDEALALRSLCTRYAVPFLINDDVGLALAARADGVHLGEHDGNIAEARTRLGGDALIGASCYDSITRAQDVAAAGADYLAFGAFAASSTKPLARNASIEVLGAARRLGLPLVAIGGITPDNAPALITAGADFIAVVSGIFSSDAAGAAAAEYAALFTNRHVT